MHLVRLSDPETHESLPLCPEDRRFCIFSTVFSTDGREILGGANDGFLYVYDLECNQRALRVSLLISNSFLWFVIDFIVVDCKFARCLTFLSCEKMKKDPTVEFL